MNDDKKNAPAKKSSLGNVGVHPKNHYKFCPRCSNEGFFDENQLAFKCHCCGFNFYLNSSAAVTALIFNEKHELLLTRRGVEPSIGMLDLPGGFIDPGENAEEAMLREIKEELDIVPYKIEYYGSFPNEYSYSGTVVYTIDITFKCTVSDFSNLKFRDDIIGLEFKKLNEIELKEVPFKSVRNILKRLQNEK